MTELQQRRARALRECRLPTFGNWRRFIGEMVQASYEPELAIISERQDKVLAFCCWHFRAQLTELGYAELIPASNPLPKPAPKAEEKPEVQVEFQL